MVGLIGNLQELLLGENIQLIQIDYATAFKIQIEQVRLLGEIRNSQDINIILGAEKSINSFYLEFYSNSKPMVSSLRDTLSYILATEKLVRILHETPLIYKNIAMGFTQDKNLINGLPKDEARQFFRGQATRLLNMDKVHLSNSQKKIIEARKSNLRYAEGLYEKMQILAINSIIS